MDATLREVRRVIKKGCRSVTFPSNPHTQGQLPPIHDAYWEPFWALCNDEHVVLNCHIGTGQPAAFASEQSPISAWISSLPMAIGTDAADLLHLRALLRYPNLKISLSEGGIGWIPYLLERTDFVLRHHGAWVRCDWGGKLPSEVFREHFLSCFIDDKFGCNQYEKVGEDIIAYECDYPHSDCTWPNVPEELWENVKDLPERVSTRSPTATSSASSTSTRSPNWAARTARWRRCGPWPRTSTPPNGRWKARTPGCRATSSIR